jgi:alpha-N-acetylglucosamine transferase
VFLDADTIVVRNIDRLLAYPEFCAAPNLYETLGDFGRMNSGVFVAAPSATTFARMLDRLGRPDAFWRRTDQTFLESFWPDWHGLPYVCNTLQYVYFNLPELWNWPQIRVVHYQYEKPWQAEHPKRDRLGPLIDLWWRMLEGRELPDELPALARYREPPC